MQAFDRINHGVFAFPAMADHWIFPRDMMDKKDFSILIVDDDPENIALLRLLLENRGHRIECADSGEAALQKASEMSPDLILLDVMLPGLNGFEVCRHIKQDRLLASIPVLFLTAKDSREERLAGFQAGAEDYITKPFFKEEVLARVQMWLDRLGSLKTQKVLRENLERANAVLEERVKERTHALQTAYQKMVIQEKMASMGKLSAGLAHELNNPINFLRNNFASLESSFNDLLPLIELYRVRNTQSKNGDGLRKYILEKVEEICLDVILEDLGNLFAESREGFERLAWLISSMRRFAKKEEKPQGRPIDLHRCVNETLSLAKKEIMPVADVDLNLGAEPEVLAHEQSLKQVLLNLIINAVQAIESTGQKGTIRILTYMKGDETILEIMDSGPGVPADVADKIFDPFFTTKEIGQGTGLGLSLSYDIIVDQHGGTLELVSSPSTGAHFRISLPGRNPSGHC